MRGSSAVSTALALSLLFGGPADVSAQTAVVSCGQMVKGDAVLPADLDCSAAPSPALRLGARAHLDLAGHALTGDVFCVDDCRVTGPGSVIGSLLSTGAGEHGNLSVSSVIVDGDIYTWHSVALSDSQLSGDIDASRVEGFVAIDDSTFDEAFGFRMIVSRSHGVRIGGDSARITGSSFENLYCRKCTVWDSDISGGGIECDQFVYTGHGGFAHRGTLALVSSSMLNTVDGILCAQKVTIEGSQLSGNTGGIWVDGFSLSPAEFDRVYGRVIIVGSEIDGGGDGEIYARMGVKVSDSNISGQETGVHTSGPIKIRNSTISGNSSFGIESGDGTVKLDNTSVVGNGDHATCYSDIPPPSCVDILGEGRHPPELVNGSSCGTSLHRNPDYPDSSDIAWVPWGVCSAD